MDNFRKDFSEDVDATLIFGVSFGTPVFQPGLLERGIMADNDNDAPKDIKFDSIVVDVCFHPTRDVIAAGDIDGDITVHSYSTREDNHLLLTLPHHKKACRALRFSPDGAHLLSASKDRSIQVVDMEAGKVTKNLDKAHKSPIYSLLVVDENIVASGDDDGCLKVWDLRQNKTVMELQECEEFISDMVMGKRKRFLLATSGDGSLSVYDIRQHKLKLKSETFDAEFLSLGIVKDEKKVVCGTGDGVLNVFNWGEWGNISDRFPGHPMSIDCILPVSDDVILTGSMDGFIRAIHVLPNRLLGLVGQHEDFPVENLSRSHCGTYVASCSHDQTVKFWNIEGIDQEEVDANTKPKKSLKKPTSKATASDFFSGLAEQGGQGDAQDSSEESDSDGDIEGDPQNTNTDKDEMNSDEDSEGNDDAQNINANKPESESEEESSDDQEEDNNQT